MNDSAVQLRHSVVKGRARIRVRGLYRSEKLKEYLERRLSERTEVNKFSISTLTGNALIYYNSGNSEKEITSLIAGLLTEYHKKKE